MSAWTSRRRRTLAGATAAGLAAAGLAAAALAPTAGAATPGTATLNSKAPAFGSAVTVFRVPAGTNTLTPGQGNFTLTAGGPPTPRTGWSVQTNAPLGGANLPVMVKTAADGGSAAVLATDSYLAAQWLIAQADALIAAAAPNQGTEAGAIAVAIWVLTGQAQAAMPTDNATLNARAAQLVALASGRRLMTSLSMTASPTTTCTGTAATLSLSGQSQESASLAVTAGNASLSAPSVTFNSANQASATVTSTQAGTATVTASGTSGTLHLVEYQQPQDPAAQNEFEGYANWLFNVPSPLSATATVQFVDCPAPVTTTTATTPGPVVAAASTPRRLARLKITKRGPRRSRAGRTIRYTIRVTNTGNATARDLTVTDRLPRDTSLARRTAGLRLVRGNPVWRIARLAPGRTRTLRLYARFDADTRGRLCNNVRVRASNARGDRARTCTLVRRLVRQVSPAVTG